MAGRRVLPYCGSVKVSAVKNAKPMSWRCKEKGCRKHFSVRTNRVFAESDEAGIVQGKTGV